MAQEISVSHPHFVASQRNFILSVRFGFLNNVIAHHVYGVEIYMTALVVTFVFDVNFGYNFYN